MLLSLLKLPSVCHSYFHSIVKFCKHDFQCITLGLFLSFHLPISFLNLFTVSTWTLGFEIPSCIPIVPFNYRTVSFQYVKVCYLCIIKTILHYLNCPGSCPRRQSQCLVELTGQKLGSVGCESALSTATMSLKQSNKVIKINFGRR